MIIRVESTLTLQTKKGHYVKEHAALELDWNDVKHLMPGDTTLDKKAIRLAYGHLHDLTIEAVWDAVDSQLNSLEGE